MALEVETGSGSPTAESYASVAFADEYFSLRGNPATWTAKTTTEKETALRLATEYLDQKYGTQFRGLKMTQAQALQWPRFNAYDDYGYPMQPVPLQLQRATVVAAGVQAEGESFYQSTAEPGLTSVSQTLGPMSESKSWANGKTSTSSKSFPSITAFVRPLLEFGGTDGGGNTPLQRS